LAESKIKRGFKTLQMRTVTLNSCYSKEAKAYLHLLLYIKCISQVIYKAPSTGS